jgi:DNA-binding beta-propeller fold protein YncE
MRAFASCLLGILLVLPATAAPRVLRSFRLGGEGRWDYLSLDPEGNRLYVPRSTRVMVLDLDGRVLGEIPGTQGVHGVAFSRELDHGWTSNGQAGTVTVFKGSSLAVEAVLTTTGGNPDAILFEPATRRVFTFNGAGKNTTVFDGATSQVVGTIPLDGKPEFAACDGRGRVYVNNQDTAQIYAINARTLKVEAVWSIRPLDRPTGLAMDVQDNLLFAVAGNRLAAVVDAGSGRLLATVPIGSGADGVAFDPATGCAYASNGEGTLTVIRRNAQGGFEAGATVVTARGARTIVANPSTHRLYLPTADFGSAGPGEHPPMIKDSFRIIEVGEAP